jgi:hypothetical protein
MSSPRPRPELEALDDLLRRYDGPVPTEPLLAARAGEPPDLLRLQALSREIDRVVLGVGRSIASHREDLRRVSASCGSAHPAIDELSDWLTRYRMLGLRLAESLPGC